MTPSLATAMPLTRRQLLVGTALALTPGLTAAATGAGAAAAPLRADSSAPLSTVGGVRLAGTD